MAHSTHHEVERKYDVEADTTIPGLVGVAGVVAVGDAQEQHLVADYLDTPGLDLARLGISLRRRQGGHDSGWHLKVPARRAGRTEIGVPLGADDEPVPAELQGLVRGAVRGRPVGAVARLLTHRTERALLDAEGSTLAMLCDDRVVAQRETAAAGVLRWREWEVELVDGDEGVLDALEGELRRAGAAPAVSRSKIRRALGVDGEHRGMPSPPDDATAGDVLTAYLAKYRDRILVTEAGVRLGSPEAVHQMRTATRRVRSVLATYRPLFDDTAVAEQVRTDLQWLGQELGRPRDAHVLREHLHETVGSLPPELALGPVLSRVDHTLGADHRDGLVAAVEALDSERYLDLVLALDGLVEAPPLGERGAEPATTALPRILAGEVRRVTRAQRAIPPPGHPGHDAAFHELRKKAKRLRYAADSAAPVLGRPARSLAKRAKALQELLGVRQDTVVARHRLRDLGVQAHLAGENGFTFGLLHELEVRRADEAEAQFARAWKRLPTSHVRRTLSGD
jgi:CHAD domain-containing protein